MSYEVRNKNQIFAKVIGSLSNSIRKQTSIPILIFIFHYFSISFCLTILTNVKLKAVMVILIIFDIGETVSTLLFAMIVNGEIIG